MKRRHHKWILFALVLAASTLAGPRIYQGYEALLMLADLAHFDIPSELDTRPAVTRHSLDYSIDNTDYQADSYQAGEHPGASLLLMHGLTPLGKDDPRLKEFAITLARARFRVLVPNIPSLRQLKLAPQVTREVTDAFSHLISSTKERAGIAAISVAVGPAILAAQQPELNGQVQFMLAIGGYYDLPRILTYHTTGHYAAQGMQQQKPNEYAKWAFVLSHLDRLENASDQAQLRSMAYRRLDNPQAPLDDLSALLGPEGRAVYAFVNNRDPKRTTTLLTGLPAAVQAGISQLNLAGKDLSQLKSRVILVHGLDDKIIPYPESEALAQALPADRTGLFMASGLQHIGTTPGTLDVWRMWRTIDTLLSERW